MSSSSKLDMQEHLTATAKKQFYVNRMFATIAPRYDLVTSLLSYGQDQRWKRKLVAMAEVQPQHQVLDLACGTGDITYLLARQLGSGQATGVDITPEMVELARRKQPSNETRVRFETGDICQLSFADASFERITAGYAVRNVPDISRLLGEVFRLLKPGGRFLSLDFGKPEGHFYRWAYLGYLSATGSALGWLLHGDPDVYRYIAESIKHYPGQSGVQRLLEETGFVECGFITFLGGAIAMNWGSKP
ncbi:MAG: ubiquinone/menaquinone biosynthesis methyltransferase [Acidobacteria bacterium]|nr:ubiquinone/menaquinone biosynthesis methyltransferase [Acidobacteriota bacterium]MCI0622875.1 ubiquinone/menaquinone biosynthesis methyltransferase [Acidobacteriota bacterium]MCI0720462.1 ubiquinone/menaquinone biosynthesis methyltransferase [Acidobacteriota bacterium]